MPAVTADPLTLPRLAAVPKERTVRPPDGASLVRIIAGELAGFTGPGVTHTPITYVHASVARDAELAVSDTWEVLLLGGVPLREPVARYGPFVMSTEAEIRTAMDDVEHGTLVRASAVDIAERSGRPGERGR